MTEIEKYYAEIIKYLCDKVVGIDTPKPIAPDTINTSTLEHVEHQALIEAMVGVEVDLTDIIGEYELQLTLDQKRVIEQMEAQLVKMDANLERLILEEATEYELSKIITEVVNDGMRCVNVTTKDGKIYKWRVDNWIRINAQHQQVKLYDGMSHEANRQIDNTVGRFSYHGGASDICDPDQGKVVDFANELEGMIEGVRVYKASDTSYAEDFGICRRPTCLHSWVPFQLGINKLRQMKPQDLAKREAQVAAENLRANAEAKIRDYKTKAYYYEKAGDNAKAAAARRKVSDLQAFNAKLTQEAGIPRRYDREKSYNVMV